MQPNSQAQQPVQKKLFLTDDEKKNIRRRQEVIEQYDYILNLLRSDFNGYMNEEVFNKRGIPKGVKVILAADLSHILVDTFPQQAPPTVVPPQGGLPHENVKVRENVKVEIETPKPTNEQKAG